MTSRAKPAIRCGSFSAPYFWLSLMMGLTYDEQCGSLKAMTINLYYSAIVCCALLSIAVTCAISPFMALMYAVLAFINASFMLRVWTTRS